MTRTKIDLNLLPYISTFERITHAKVKFCMEDLNKDLVFIVDASQMGIALGKQASNIPRLEYVLRKRVRLVAYSDDVAEFTRNVIFPVRDVDVMQEGDSVVIASEDKKLKGQLIGRDGNVLRNYEHIIKNFFPIQKVEVR